jgi:6-phosphogluconolactonase
VLPDPTAVARRGAAIVAERARTAVGERGRCTIAVSGGSTPWAMLAGLEDEDVPWRQTTVFQVDERVAPDGDPERNLTHLRKSLPRAALASIVPMSVDEQDLDAAAAAYAATLPERFDLVHLGLGSDGHTASLVPGDPVLDVADRDVAVTGEYAGRRRMTLTFPTLGRARVILWLITGEDKAEALERLLAGDPSIPASRVASPEQLVIADRAATQS